MLRKLNRLVCFSTGLRQTVAERCTRVEVPSHQGKEDRPQHHVSKWETKSRKPKLLHVGQPYFETHPHLVKSNEVTPGITKEEYSLRRNLLIEKLIEAYPRSHHVVVLPAFPKRYMIDKIPFLYRQDTDMLYLSGCLEPDCILVIHTLGSSVNKITKSVMFTPQYDPGQELWDGPKTTPEGACDLWGVDEGLPSAELMQYLQGLQSSVSDLTVWYSFEPTVSPNVDMKLMPWLRESSSMRVLTPKPHIHILRAKKSSSEVRLMRKTCQVTFEGIAATMKSCPSPASEHCLFAAVDYHCRIRGADYLAYPPVVAGGPRANIIHYIRNNNIIHDGDLVLMDAGAECAGYTADITRTWPVSGRFTRPQRELYEGVLEVQKHVIKALSDRPSLDRLFVIMCSKLGSILQELGILPDSFSSEQLTRSAYGFCPHHVSHYLGMDVHDTPSMSRSQLLTPGNVITVEPGIYISEKNTAVPFEFRGIGVRIEDDVLITEGGVEILTKACPKHPDDIEKIVGSDITQMSEKNNNA